MEDGDDETPGVPAEAGSEELPFPGNRFPLEVVAEGKIAEHLEESVVAGRGPHVLEIRHAQALLGGRDPPERPSAPEELVLELIHPGSREEERGIVPRHEAVRGHARVPPGFEEAQESLADRGDGARLVHPECRVAD